MKANQFATTAWDKVKRDLFVMSLLTCSLVLNVYLGWRVRSQTFSRDSQQSDLAIGTHVPSLVVKTPFGQDKRVVVQGQGKPTVIYVFTPSCRWCAKNLANIKALASSRSDKFAFVGVSLSAYGLNEYASANGLTFGVYSKPTGETIATYRLGKTPQTLVVGPDGLVAKNWIGAYVGTTQKDVEQFFDIKLPGITADVEGGD